MVLQSFTEFYQVSQGCTGFYWISSDCHGFYWVLPGITALQQFPTSLIRRWKRWKKICFGFSGFFLSGMCTEFYRVRLANERRHEGLDRPKVSMKKQKGQKAKKKQTMQNDEDGRGITTTRRPRPAKGFDEEAKRPEGQEEADDAKR